MILTERRDDILRAMVDAAEGTLVPSELPDQAGAVRDLVAAMKRSPIVARPARPIWFPARGSRRWSPRCCSWGTPSPARVRRSSGSPALLIAAAAPGAAPDGGDARARGR